MQLLDESGGEQTEGVASQEQGSPLQDLLTQPREIGIVGRDVEVQATQRIVHLDRDGESENTSDIDVEVAGQVEVDEARSFGKKFGEGDGSFGREVGRVEKDSLEVRVDGDGGTEGGDLCVRTR